MIALPRAMCRAARSSEPPDYSAWPIQIGMRGDAWRVTVASILLHRTRRVTAEPVIRDVFNSWPTPEALAKAEGLEYVIRSLGFQRNRSQALRRLSFKWAENTGWEDLRDLPSCGPYVVDAVGLCVFGCLDLECRDEALVKYRVQCLQKLQTAAYVGVIHGS